MQFNLSFLLVALITLTAAAAAMRLRNLVHCALCGAVAFGGLAIAYLLLDAEFVALAQWLIYVGAVAILILFGIMLTRDAEVFGAIAPCAPRPWIGLAAAGLLGALLVFAVMAVPVKTNVTPAAVASVRQIGIVMISQYAAALEALGLLLTAALIGAVVLAMKESAPVKPSLPKGDRPGAIGPKPSPLELQPLIRQ